MTSDSDVAPEQVKERTKWLWAAVVIIILVMLVVLWGLSSSPYEGESVVRAKHILIQFNPRDATDRASALELISELRQRIVDGGSFAKLAREFSADTYSRARGGDLNYMPKGSFEEAFEKYVWQAPIGEISNIVTTAHGFHLIVVLDRHLSETDAYQQRILDQTFEQKATGAQETEESP